MKILITGFKPFLGETFNPSEKLANDLEKEFVEVDSLILPVEFESSYAFLSSEKNLLNYDYVLLLGQATGRSKVSFEKVALNWVQTDNADERGFRPITGKIKPREPQLALMTEFNIDKLLSHLKEKKLPVEVNFSAGSFVCNDLYYRTLLAHPHKKVCFVHVPMTLEQNKTKQTKVFLEYEVIYQTMVETLQILRGGLI